MKRGRKRGGCKDKVFGCDLLEHLTATNQEIPHVLRSCSEFIEEHGIVDGIYRLSGVSSNTQRLRSEFDNEGNPDIYKDVYLQDIHCVSSLCKAYFRELPNPLLTYQLYDRFADAVAIQLEDERLVKIKEVLKDLPCPHFKTLEYLMRHLVKMSTYSAETNMHARNLAIVWAPNLLRSKDIEASGFNGTAAFMEVRVQSIVVEFILTHVPQLFPESDTEPGLALERRKSLPSPSALLGHEEQFFKAIQYPGNLSPGDGPPAMRSYHAIIDGTDKRKGSLKGRKWRSIFNLGGRLPDPRKKSKYTAKEKEKTSLRPAKSMDSLSSGASTMEDSRHPSSHLSPLVTSSGPTEGGTMNSGGVSSGYAVTYRRTGGASVSMVSGGSGTQGTYKSLDSGGGAGVDKPQATLQGAASKAERRAGMHISGPFSVTVPLHITSGLALGVLHGVRNEEESPQQGETEEEPKTVEIAGENEQPTTLQTGGNQGDDAVTEVKVDDKESGPSEEKEKYEDKTAEPEKRDSQDDEEDYLSEEEKSSTNQLVTKQPSFSEDKVESDYMDMKPGVQIGYSQNDMSHNPLCNEEEYPDQELPFDFQDTFGFLDSMDTSATTQLNEFSVEPPGFEEEEDEEEDEQNLPPACPSWSQPDTEKYPVSEMNFNANMHRPLPGKSHSLPYKSRPFLPLPSFSSDEEDYTGPDDDDDDDDEEDDTSDKAEYEDMFCKSLPSAQHFQGLNWTSPQTVTLNSTDCGVESNASTQSECQKQTDTELTESSQDLPPVDQSESLTQTDTEMTTNNGMDAHAVDQDLSEGDLSPLPLETEHLSLDEKKTKDKNPEESISEEDGHVNEPIQETNEKLESAANEDPHICSQEEKCSMASEDDEDTYFGPDATSTLPEPNNIETSYTNYQLSVEEEHTSVDSQQAGCFDVTVSEVKLIDEPVLDTESTSLTNQDETKELLVEPTLILHDDKQDKADSRAGDEGIDQISVIEENVVKDIITEREQIQADEVEESSIVTEEDISERPEESSADTVCEISEEKKQEEKRVTTEKVESEEDAKHKTAEDSLEKKMEEVEEEEQTVLEKNEVGVEKLSTKKVKEGRDVCEISEEKKQENERVVSEKGESKEVEEDAKHKDVGDSLEKEIVEVGEDEQTILEKNEDGVENLINKKVKRGRDGGEESNEQMEKDDMEEEAGARDLEGVTEIKEGSVPEQRIVSEMSEGEDSGDFRESEVQEKEGEKARTKVETNVEVSSPGGGKPLRPPRMKEIEGGKGVGLGPGVGRTVLISKNSPTKVFHAKAVPVVPPKPQHSKITAFKQQFQQRDNERQHTDKGLQQRDTVRHLQEGVESSDKDKEPSEAQKEDLGQNHDHSNNEQDSGAEGQMVEENKAKVKDVKDTPSGEMFLSLGWEVQRERRGTWDGGSKKDGQKDIDRETKRASGISICFDEAVARATGKRCREKEDRFIDLQWERGDQKEGSIQRKREEEGTID